MFEKLILKFVSFEIINEILEVTIPKLKKLAVNTKNPYDDILIKAIESALNEYNKNNDSEKKK